MCTFVVSKVKNLLDVCGFSNIWISQCYGNDIRLKNALDLLLQDQYKPLWNTQWQESTKAVNYIYKKKLEKLDLNFEKYFDIMDICTKVLFFCRYRITNHRLPIETGM